MEPKQPKPQPLEARPADNRHGTPCDICGYPTLALHCKLSCERCGAKRDCSDF